MVIVTLLRTGCEAGTDFNVAVADVRSRCGDGVSREVFAAAVAVAAVVECFVAGGPFPPVGPTPVESSPCPHSAAFAG